jgi:hypothetical protein
MASYKIPVCTGMTHLPDVSQDRYGHNAEINLGFGNGSYLHLSRHLWLNNYWQFWAHCPCFDLVDGFIKAGCLVFELRRTKITKIPMSPLTVVRHLSCIRIN